LHAVESWITLHAEYQTIAATQADRWDQLVSRSGLTPTEQERVRLSPARDALYAALTEAEAAGLAVNRVFPLLARGDLDDADDPAAVLHGRVQRWTTGSQTPEDGSTKLIAGLVPRATGARDPELDPALADRELAMEGRAQELAQEAFSSGKVWIRKLGDPPRNLLCQRGWLAAAATVAAYRERWSLGNDPRPLGSESLQSLEQLAHRRRAQTAVETALTLVRQERSWRSDSPTFGPGITPEAIHQGPEL
jgi:hypothetical protein